MMRQQRLWAVILLLASFFSLSLLLEAGMKDDEVLFPRREYVKRQSELFFKQVSLNQPLVEKVAFFANSNAYLSAYMAFSPYLEKQAFFKKLFSEFEMKKKERIKQFKESQKSLTIENYPQFLKKMGCGKTTLALTILYSLVVEYRGNSLSGDTAFRLWNVFLKLTEAAFEEKEKLLDNAALLTMASHLVFFKKVKKWQKQSQKILKKLAPQSMEEEKLILGIN